MGCCNCNCINKLEHVEKVIAEYDPTEKFINYKLLTIWLNRKTGKAFILVSKKDGIAVWQPIDLEISAIEKIILNCGEVTANEKNEIIHTGECGARTVTDDCKDFCINVRTSWGIAGGKIVCAGESIDLSLKPEETNIVTSNITDGKDGDSVVLDGDSGKVLKKAQQWRIGDSENSWTGRFDPETKNLNIFPDDKATEPMLTMLPSGVILTPNQPKFSARLTASTPVFAVKQYYKIGSTLAFEKIRDEDGYNKNANNFFPGDGAGNFAYFTCPYPGVWGIQYQFVIDQGQTTAGTRMVFRIAFGKPDAYQYLKYEYRYTNNSAQTIANTRFIPLKKDDTFHFEILIDSDTAKPFIRNDTSGTEISNYCGVYLALG